MAKNDDLESFWADVCPKAKRSRRKPLTKLPEPIVRGQVWAGLFGPDGKELSYEGYERQPVPIPSLDPRTRQMEFPIIFPTGTVLGVVESVGLWETKTGEVLIHRTTSMRPVHITDSDTLTVNLVITDADHPYGGVANMMRMRGLL